MIIERLRNVQISGKNLKTKVVNGLILSAAALSLLGCVDAAIMAAQYVPQLIGAGADAIAGLENVDVKSAVSPGITIDEIQKNKTDCRRSSDWEHRANCSFWWRRSYQCDVG
ncbi:MAG: hypothetical protein JW884_11690 [Deltaproteobacteria bacterium]|nr:hypothetical protein [Deltaproteobacteria bacterium]